MKSYKEGFIQFLEDNEALSEFEIHLSGLEEEHYETIEEYLDTTMPRLYVSDAFWWGKTASGYNYWNNLDDKWGEVLSKD